MDNNINRYTEAAEILKVLAHPVRLCIVSGLLEKGECNVNYMHSCLKAPQSTVSQHLQKLKAAGIIEGRREGLEIYYRVSDERVADLIRILTKEVD
ncbi:ArsR/SmtB family transcription factor [Anaerocolumna xylanovorans]|uniref:ArsR family transcriptional regulator n=1 Tax=Anaerocolumna xylanovorans DSM 12503 TaxID=1121345 RepID=A0A1M7YIX4_9FIRM|nr:metalloregulator ArsR/SmtB family transcription factor [Anaerocolumna xylanovorans]SHO52521.1 ArsR family transcriptional regulator [Anaerocolumna xylanovorans DSM 12503]